MPRLPPPPRRRHRRSLQAISEFAAALAVRLIDQPPLYFDGHPALVLSDAAPRPAGAAHRTACRARGSRSFFAVMPGEIASSAAHGTAIGPTSSTTGVTLAEGDHP